MDPSVLYVAAILFAAAYLQSATGFGLALVCMALVPLILPVSEAIAYVAIASLIVNSGIMIANRAGLCWRRALPLCIGIILGIPIGYFALRSLDGKLVIQLLGVTLMLISAAEFLQGKMARLHIPEKAGGFLGLLGGILAGAFNVGGPPIVVYTYSRDWSKVEIVAILQTVFLAGGLTRNLLMLGAGEVTVDLLILTAWTVPTAILAVWLGKKTLERLPLQLLRRFVFGLIFLIGLSYLLKG
ncbi:MAG: sulfite exporter TauE/SafE family protein [Verrucomicrobiota bacterium]